MAIATPVLERKVNETTDSAQDKTAYKSTYMTAEEMHNARIKDNYARLINPDNKLEDLFASAAATEVKEEQTVAEVEKENKAIYTPYLVQNARADADIFRADSAVNKRVNQAVSYEADEEENEDLCPTKTTIQYRTAGEMNKKEDATQKEQKHASVLGKKEKIIIATFVSIVVALFVLVIINSAIIANFNSDIAAIQSGIVTVKGVVNGGATSEGALNQALTATLL
jgi:hypothetical protein